MSETTNYKLYLTSDNNEKFRDWREKMNGTEDSNMIKIDNALGEKAKCSVAIYTTLFASAWNGANAPFTQELSIEGLTSEQNGVIDIAHNATSEQREVAREAMLAVTSQDNGKLVISADGELPVSDIPVVIILLG